MRRDPEARPQLRALIIHEWMTQRRRSCCYRCAPPPSSQLIPLIHTCCSPSTQLAPAGSCNSPQLDSISCCLSQVHCCSSSSSTQQLALSSCDGSSASTEEDVTVSSCSCRPSVTERRESSCSVHTSTAKSAPSQQLGGDENEKETEQQQQQVRTQQL